MRLLCYQWSHGSIPMDDERRLNLICGGKPSPNVRAKFSKVETVWVNLRMEIERKKQQEFREERSKSGQIGADRRWHSHSSANGSAIKQPMANGMANDGSPSPSPSPNNTPIPPNGEVLLSPTQKRMGKLFNRRESTRWSKPELKALKEIEPIPEEDFRAVEKYYTLTIPKDSDFRRHDLVTLLNNWNGEVDRARKFRPAKEYNL